MKHFDYHFTETWSGYFEVTAESQTEADEIVRKMSLTDPKTGLRDSISFNYGRITPSAEWDEENEIFYDEDEANRPVRDVRIPLLFDLVPPPRIKSKPAFTREELTIISDALARAVTDASRAAALVDSPEAKEIIRDHIIKLQALLRKAVRTK